MTLRFSDYRPRFGLPLGLALYVGTFVLSLVHAAWADQKSGLVRIGTKDGRAHGCVVEGRFITAGHVADGSKAITWQDFEGREGIAIPAEGEKDNRDVLIMKPTPDVGYGYKLSKVRPKAGDRLRVFGYARGKRNPFQLVTLTTEVVAVSDGYVFYDRTPGPGSSGACVLNAQDEVVAINVGIWRHSEHTQTPLGVDITGMWGLP